MNDFSLLQRNIQGKNLRVIEKLIKIANFFEYLDTFLAMQMKFQMF